MYRATHFKQSVLSCVFRVDSDTHNQYKQTVSKLANKHYYDHFSATYEAQRHDGYHAFVDDLESELVRRYVHKATRLLEAGCGTGLVLNRLAPFAASAVGVDLSLGMLRHAAKRSLPVVQGSVCDLPFKNESFDVVCSFKVLAHVEQIEQAMRELTRVLRPGGFLLTEFYNPLSLRYLIKRLKQPTVISGDIHDEAVFTRYDSLGKMQSYLPAEMRFEDVFGIRVVTPFSAVHSWPWVGLVLRSVERKAAVLPLIRRFGGFLVLVARKE